MLPRSSFIRNWHPRFIRIEALHLFEFVDGVKTKVLLIPKSKFSQCCESTPAFVALRLMISDCHLEATGSADSRGLSPKWALESSTITTSSPASTQTVTFWILSSSVSSTIYPAQPYVEFTN